MKILNVFLFNIFYLTILFSNSSFAFQNVTGVDLRDLAKYRTDVPEAPVLVASMLKKPELYFPKGVGFHKEGAGTSLDKKRRNTVYGIEFPQAPTSDANNGTTTAFVTALVHTDSKDFYFLKMAITLDSATQTVTSVVNQAEIPLSKTQFSIQVSLGQRKLILADWVNGIQKVYPLGVGSIDMGIRDKSVAGGKTVSMTPQFKNASLDSNLLYEAKNDLTYKGMPLLPIIPNGSSRPAEEAFHIVQHATVIDLKKNKFDYNHMVRGFDSHGCMRLREKDLYELYSIARNSGQRYTPVDISNWLPALPDHPYPLNDAYYKTVKNHGTALKPFPGADSAGYTDLERINTPPPVTLLEEWAQ